MTLNGVIVIISHYFAEFGSFRGQLCRSGWSAISRFSPEKCHKIHQEHVHVCQQMTANLATHNVKLGLHISLEKTKIIQASQAATSQPIYSGQTELINSPILAACYRRTERSRKKWTLGWQKRQQSLEDSATYGNLAPLAWISNCSCVDSHICQWNMEKHEDDTEQARRISSTNVTWERSLESHGKTRYQTQKY